MTTKGDMGILIWGIEVIIALFVFIILTNRAVLGEVLVRETGR
jgi:hypothetical protein